MRECWEHFKTLESDIEIDGLEWLIFRKSLRFIMEKAMLQMHLVNKDYNEMNFWISSGISCFQYSGLEPGCLQMELFLMSLLWYGSFLNFNKLNASKVKQENNPYKR